MTLRNARWNNRDKDKKKCQLYKTGFIPKFPVYYCHNCCTTSWMPNHMFTLPLWFLYGTKQCVFSESGLAHFVVIVLIL